MVKGVEDGIAVRQREYGVGPITSLEHALDKNFRAGIIAGMKFAVVYANSLFQQLDETITEKLAENRKLEND